MSEHRGAQTPGHGQTVDLHAEFEVLRASIHRKHGDPFPLPVLRADRRAGLGPEHPLRRVEAGLRSLDDLAAVPFDSTMRDPKRAMTQVQEWILNDVWRRVDFYGAPPAGLNADAALQEICSSKDLYAQKADVKVAAFDITKIKVLKRQLEPKDTISLGTDEVRHYLQSPEELIVRPSWELEAADFKVDLPEPFWSPELRRSLKRRIELYGKLRDANLLTFRRRRRARAGIFTVMKKDGMQRLIVDARQANACHYTPPKARLSTPSGILAVDFSEVSMENSGFGGVAGDWDPPSGEAGDVGDCFYNFQVPFMASWFAFDDRFTTQQLLEFGLMPDAVFDEERGVDTPVREGETLFPCFGGMPMGWSWSLFFANEVVVKQSSLPFGGSFEHFIRDKQPAPVVKEGRPVLGVYVDNVSIFASKTGEAGAAMARVKGVFDSLKIPFVVDGFDGSGEFEGIGLHLSFGGKVWAHAKRQRAWRLWFAGLGLLRRGRVHGRLLQIWVGHVTHHFQIMKPAMAALSACYRFINDHGHHRAWLWPKVRREIRTCMGLFFLVERDLSASVSREVHVGDSSNNGYSLMTTQAPAVEVLREMQYRERWRFIETSEPEVADSVSRMSPPVCLGDLQDTSHRGVSANSTIGAQTAYGQELSRAYERAARADLRSRTKRLTGPRMPAKTRIVEASAIPKISSAWSNEQRWTLVVARRWDKPEEHINLKEARVALMGLRRLTRTVKNLGARALSLCDNMSAVLAFEKGRSSAHGLNGLCRRAAAYQIACRIQWHLRHVESAENVADGPSRWFKDPAPQPGPAATPLRKGATPVSSEAEEGSRSGAGMAAPGLGAQTAGSSSGRHFAGFGRQRGGLCLEIFSGSGRLTSSLKKAGLATLPDVDVTKGDEYNVLRKETQQYILGLIQKRRVRYIHFGTPCTVFSRARHGIRNLTRARHHEAVGVALAAFTCRCIRMLLKCDGFFSLENPENSRLWDFSMVSSLFHHKSVSMVRWDMCMYGTPYKKATGLLTNLEGLNQLSRRCNRQHRHLQLRGSEKVRQADGWVQQPRTKNTAAYPPDLTTLWAEVVRERLLGHTVLSKSRSTGYFGMEFQRDLKEIAFRCHGRLEKPSGGPVPKGHQEASARSSGSCAIKEAQRLIRSDGVIFGQNSNREIDAIQAKAAGYRAAKGPAGSPAPNRLSVEGTESQPEDAGPVFRRDC